MKKKELYKKVLPKDPLFHPFLKRALIMFNWSLILTFLLCTQVYAVSYPQTARVDLNLKSTSLKKALSVLEQRGDIRLLYSEEFLPKKEVSLVSKDMPVLDALSEILKETNLNYRVFGDGLVVIISPQGVVVQDIVVRGKVNDLNGEPLIGVSIRLKGTSTGVTTDINGNFSIETPENGTLVFSYIGFLTKEVTVASQTTMQVQLDEDTQTLSEVVVTGYTTEQKKDIIGSVAVVNTEDMLSTPSGNVTNQLQGRASGVTVSSSGTPGSSGKVRIRGFGSFGSSDPLYIVDGVPSSVDDLNPNDIESVQVLKDAASASVYGARAANGVIIITTKKGKAGKSKITFNSYYATNYVSSNDFPELLSAQENGELYWKSMIGAGRKVGDANWTHPQYGTGATPVIPEYILVNNNGPKIGGTVLEQYKTTNPALFAQLTDPDSYNFKTHQIVRSSNTNWFDEVFNPAPMQSYNVGASGGSDQGVYSLGLNAFSQGNTANAYGEFDRYTLRANTSYNVAENIRIGENIQVAYRKNKDDYSDVATAWTMHPLIPVWDEYGNPAGAAAPGLVGVASSGQNPVTEAWRNRFDLQTAYAIMGNAYLEADITKDLVARTSFGIDYMNSTNRNLTQSTYEHAENRNPPNSLAFNYNNNNTWTWTNTLAYNKIIDKHAFKILLGSEAIKSYFENSQASRQNFVIDDDPDFLVLSAGIGAQTNSGSFVRNSLFSLFSRVDYTYNDRYLFNATVRRDESSKFGTNSRIGYFPSAALGWRISSENFMKDISWLNDLKLRGSWGIIGNQTGLAYDNQYNVYSQNETNTYSISGANNSRATSFILSSVGNLDARWEKSTTTNIGFDATLFSNSLTIAVDLFNRKTSDLLVQNQAPLTGTSASQPSVNVGDMTNKGIDLGITKRGMVVDGFRYEVGLTFTKYKNKVDNILNNPAASLVGGNTRAGNATLTKSGYPISFFYGYQLDGFFNTQDEVDSYNQDNSTWLTPAVGRWKIKDINGDHKVDADDRTYLGSPHPDFQTGLNLSLNYKNLDFTGFLFWSQGGKVFNGARYNVDFNTFSYGRSKRMLYESWTPELGDNAKLPKLDLNDTYSSSNVTDYFLEDASFLRLKTLQLGYTFPKSIISKIKLDNLRIYVQGQNLLTISKSTLLDPDNSLSSGGDTSMGVVNNSIPTPRQILFGINFGF